MRRYNMITGILLILSIVDFALAAPVSVQEDDAHFAAVKIPESVTTVMGKRLGEELEKLGEEYFKTSEKTVDSSGTHLPSSSAPSETDHGSTNDVQSPTQPTQPTSNTDQLPCCSPLQARGNSKSCRKTCIELLEHMGEYDVSTHPGPMVNYGDYHKIPTEPPELQWIPMTTMKTMKSSADADPWAQWRSAESPPSSPTASRPMRPKMDLGQPSGHAPSPPESENWALPGNWQGPRPFDLQEARYRAKGKAKIESLSIPGTSGDTWNAVQGGET